MFKIRLKIVRNNDTNDPIYIDMMKEASNATINQASLDYKVESGNRLKGILKGIGLQSVGRTMNFTIPLFEQQKIDTSKDINKLISYYNSLLCGAHWNKYYVEFFIDNEWYSNECKITKNTSLSIDYVNLVKSYGITCLLLDNYFYSNKLKEVELEVNKAIGLQEIEYEAETDTITQLEVLWNMSSNKIGQVSAYYYVNSNYGISFNDSTDELDISYNIQNNSIKRGDIVVEPNGIFPFLYPGKNIISLYTNKQTEDFIIKYRKGVLI